MSLHNDIMNISANTVNASLAGYTDDEFKAYKYGHRDARHEAAEMALGIEEINAELVEALANLLSEWNFQMSSYEPLKIAIEAEKALLKALK